jgi:hypothetical protein
MGHFPPPGDEDSMGHFPSPEDQDGKIATVRFQAPEGRKEALARPNLAPTESTGPWLGSSASSGAQPTFEETPASVRRRKRLIT